MKENILKIILSNAANNTEIEIIAGQLNISLFEAKKIRKGGSAKVDSDKLLDFIYEYMAQPRIIIKDEQINTNQLKRREKMEEKEAIEILESQFKTLSDQSKECEPECLKDITDSMLNIYTTLYRCQSFAM